MKISLIILLIPLFFYSDLVHSQFSKGKIDEVYTGGVDSLSKEIVKRARVQLNYESDHLIFLEIIVHKHGGHSVQPLYPEVSDSSEERTAVVAKFVQAAKSIPDRWRLPSQKPYSVVVPIYLGIDRSSIHKPGVSTSLPYIRTANRRFVPCFFIPPIIFFYGSDK